MITKMMTKVMTKSSKVNQRMSSRYSRGKLKNTSRFKRKVEFKNQDSRIKLSRIKINIQDSRFKNQEKA